MEYSNYSIISASQVSDHIQGVYCKYHRELASDIYHTVLQTNTLAK